MVIFFYFYGFFFFFYTKYLAYRDLVRYMIQVQSHHFFLKWLHVCCPNTTS